MIRLNDVQLNRGSKTLFQDVNITIHTKKKVGLIGANGCGKSSLFALIRGELTTETGDIDLPKDFKIAHLAQELPATKQSALDYVLDGDEYFREIETKLAHAQNSDDGNLIATLHAEFAHIEGFSAHARAGQLLHGLGFSYDEQQKQVKDFSGGWRIRLNLAKALMCPSDLLLLDEPTNHLDLDAIIWLEKWLQRYTGTLLLISHDRDFLDSIVDGICHVEHQTMKFYTGNYSQFETERALHLANQQAAHDKQQRIRAHMQKFIDRFRAKATKAKQAQSRLRALDKMELIAAAHVDSQFEFHFPEPDKQPNPLICLDRADLGYSNPEKTVLTNICLTLSPGKRIGLLGPNGAGKSTFVKCLANNLEPLKGTLTLGHGLKIGYFAQHQLEQLDYSSSPAEHIQKIDPKATMQAIRNFLGGFNFSNDQALTSIESFSGGEKARLALAIIAWQKPNILLLDEPTNHLDLEMRQALVTALQEYTGSMILVSHDRHLLKTSCDEFYLIANSKVEEFSGDLDDYVKWLMEYRKFKLSEEQKPKRKLGHKEHKSLTNKLKSIEKKIEALTGDKQVVMDQLAEPDIYEDTKREQAIALQQQQKSLEQELEDLEEQWLEINSKLEE